MTMPDTDAEPDCEAAAAARADASTCAAARTSAASTPSFNLATKDRPPARNAAAESEALFRHGQRQPDVRALAAQSDRRACKARRRHADDLNDVAGHADGPANHGRITVESAPPEVVGNDGHGGVRGLAFIWKKRTPQRRVRAEHVEVVLGDQQAEHRTRLGQLDGDEQGR